MDDRLRRVGVYFGLLDDPEPDPPAEPKPLRSFLTAALIGAVVGGIVAATIQTLLGGHGLTAGAVAGRAAVWAPMFLVIWLSADWRERRRAREAGGDST